MKIVNPEQAKQLLLDEYPQLYNTHLSIIKQFKSTNNRIFNTFLGESSLDGYQRFIAKGIVHEMYSLESEWNVLKILQAKNADAPKLLLSQHKPKNFLLMEFIRGENAAKAVEEKKNGEKIFAEVGKTTGKLHRIEVERFGNLLNSQHTSWKEYLHNKISERLNGAKELISSELYINAQQLFTSLETIIERESVEQPRLIHRDIYLENFILQENSEKLILLDYAMAIGGRPFYDLAKFYILELYYLPEQKNTFLNAYQKYIPLPTDFKERMKLYIFKEALGMIYFLHSIGEDRGKKHAIKVLEELTKNKGIITQLLS